MKVTSGEQYTHHTEAVVLVRSEMTSRVKAEECLSDGVMTRGLRASWEPFPPALYIP